MPPTEPVRVQVLYTGRDRRVGLVTFSEHPRIRRGAVAFTSPFGPPDVLIPVLFSSCGGAYRAHSSPLRAREDEQGRLYFMGQEFGPWFPAGA